MKTTIRQGVFETNSSSTHSLTMVSESEWERFKSGELVYDRDKNELVENNAFLRSDDEDDDDYEWRYLSYTQFFEENEYETFTKRYITKSGEAIVGFGYYGYN